MTDPRRSRRVLIHMLMVTALGGTLLWAGAVTVFAADKTIEVTGSTIAWTPSTATIAPGGTVEFKSSASFQHGVNFQSPPAAPNCTGVPTVGTASPWNGTCTFTQSGSYPFVCPVHPSMTGTITVSGPTAPVVTTEPATVTKDTEATLNGKINPSGEATTYWFEYGLTNAYGSETTHQSAGSGGVAVSKSAPVSGLTTGTEYHFRIFAENGTGTSMGIDRTFRTGAPPTATTDPATGIGPVSATLQGTVNPKGLETKYFFNYGKTEAYGQKTTESTIATGQSNVAASKQVLALEPETEYHFQIIAKNSAAGGEVMGADRTFTTTGGPVATTGQASEIGETTATVKGVVNPQGQATKYFFNYGTTTSYGQKTSETSVGAGTADVNASSQLTGLAPGTAYHFQLVAKSAGGTTSGLDGTLTTESTPPPPPPPPPPGAPPTPTPLPTPSPIPPDTKITLKPAAKTRDRTPTIKFRSSVAGSSFQCSVDRKPFKACRSPFTAPSLKPGRHRIRVKAVASGLIEQAPASCSFKVVAAKKAVSGR
jgi:plastocyanin